MRKQVCQAVGSGVEANKKRVGGRNDSEIVYSSQILADAVNAVAAANRCGVMAGDVISKTDARLPDRGVFVV